MDVAVAAEDPSFANCGGSSKEAVIVVEEVKVSSSVVSETLMEVQAKWQNEKKKSTRTSLHLNTRKKKEKETAAGVTVMEKITVGMSNNHYATMEHG